MKKVIDNIDKFHDYGIYIPERTIYIGSVDVSAEHGESGTDAALAEAAIKNLFILEAMGNDPIKIIQNNVGGDEHHGMAVYDAIRNCKSEVTIIGMGNIHSMGSVIFQSGDVRIIAPNAKQLIHYGTPLHADPDMHAKSQWSWTEECKRFSRWMEEMYLEKIREKHPDFKLRKLQEMLNFDKVLDARESVNMGLADKILGEDDDGTKSE